VLPLRAKELSLLSHLLIGLITKSNPISRKILVVGKKSLHVEDTVLFLVDCLKKYANKRKLSINSVFVDCKKWRNRILIFRGIFGKLQFKKIQQKSTKKVLFKKLAKYLENYDSHLILVLNNFQYFKMQKVIEIPRISIIGIIDDMSKLKKLPSKISEGLKRNIIKFSNYSIEQIIDILKQRADISLQKNVISDELIEQIAKLAFTEGSYEFGLVLLQNAGRIAEKESLPVIDARIVDSAYTLLRSQGIEWRPTEIYPEDRVAY
jgi:Cdc6-like AAA superfamily ATPase